MTATAFCLHALGSSSEEFAALRTRLHGTLDLVGIDLPGFGTSPAASGTTVEEMAVLVERAIGTSGATEWALIGHSMGGKVAAVVAGRTMSGANGLFGLRAVVLLAASPLSPRADGRGTSADHARLGRRPRDRAGRGRRVRGREHRGPAAPRTSPRWPCTTCSGPIRQPGGRGCCAAVARTGPTRSRRVRCRPSCSPARTTVTSAPTPNVD
ncbi:alpha/beta fold hydrolase [Curtobacterium sp. MCJR17_043]|uniref:alpha/beta fold hydrolase n=1 Tax=Curtobacterium sp. MCJR17_043 TaxID=2175660 RepID=UPI0024DF6098|nr:alpha/beta fold hydrolase [Curtobacterium sp. MCJR17_043]WIB36625.1 alpha/beta fold hydrolase [Curtobacterium sp. MCJR17_043]